MESIQEIKKHLGSGDYSKIAKMVGVSRRYARTLLERTTAKKHEAVKDAAKKVAQFNIDTQG